MPSSARARRRARSRAAVAGSRFASGSSTTKDAAASSGCRPTASELPLAAGQRRGLATQEVLDRGPLDDAADPLDRSRTGRSRGSPARTPAPPRPSPRRSAAPGPGARSRSVRAMSPGASAPSSAGPRSGRARELARVGVGDQAVDRADQGALAAAGRAGDEEDLAGLDREVRGRGSPVRWPGGSGRSGRRSRRAAGRHAGG